MIVFKCKMCGGEMSLEEGATVAECPYCMTKQTLPKLDNDKRANMYDRANHFRRQNEYDKAMAIFESILQEDRTDAEAYWSLVLCRYGIEYVEDPATHKRVPTVNRVQYTSILADEDYKSALEYADFAQRSVYEEEAKAIDEIQRGILAISKQEKPFDVFICYKETDANGRRTPDSVLANDLYHQLTNEGFKVFFSRITLEDKIGTAYEPYIFAALNSAKVMVVLGTKPEYFNAVWVKNEWSRYLALIRTGADKTLVPAYRDMDPYDLPEEFSHLQAQDMGKLGFMQDLIRGIKKLTTKETPKPQTVVQQSVGAGVNIENLMKRVRLFLEDSNYASADEYLDRVLDENAEYAPAYIGKVLVKQKLRREEDLGSTLLQYEQDPNWAKALRFATPEQKGKYETYLENSNQARREKELNDQYNAALKVLTSATDEQGCYQAKRQFMQISSYKDSQARMEECDKKALRIAYDRAENKRLAIMRQIKTVSNAMELEKLATEFKKLGDYSDAKSKAQLCRHTAETMKESLYDAATEKLEKAETVSDVEAAERVFWEYTLGYKNASGRLTECRKKKELFKKIEELQTRKANLDRQKASLSLAKQYEVLAKNYQALEESFRCNAALAKANAVRDSLYQDALSQMQSAETKYAYEKAYSAFKELEDYRDSLAKAQECLDAIEALKRAEEQAAIEAKRKNRKMALAITIPSLVIITTLILLFTYVIPKGHYDKGVSLMAEKQWDAAREEFMQAGNNDEASNKAKEADYNSGIALLAEQKWDEAKAKFVRAGDYNDSAVKAKEADYQKATQLLENGNYEDALLLFKSLDNYSDSETQCRECIYQRANNILASNDYDSAYKEFKPIKGYKDVDSILSTTIELRTAIGNYITIGAYKSTPIEWMIIWKENDKVILLSRNILGRTGGGKLGHYYGEGNTQFDVATIEKKAKDICKEAFSDSENALVTDITILTKDEIERYLPSASDRIANSGSWWTRTFVPGTSYRAFVVSKSGSFESVDASGTFGVRPSITISSSALIQFVRGVN